MPVLVETVSRPSAQDHTDLGKVYADAPDWHGDRKSVV